MKPLFVRLGGQGGWVYSLRARASAEALNATTDVDFTETIGRKADTAVKVPSTTASAMAMLKGILGASGNVTSVQTPDGSATTWTQASHRLFTVTGEVFVHAIFGVVDEILTGAATGEVGVSGSTASLIAQTAELATKLNEVNDIWIGRAVATHARYVGILPSDGGVIVSDIDIDLTIGAANVTNGQITFYVIWSPLSSDGALAAGIWD